MGVGQGQRCPFSEPDKLLGNKRQTLDVCCCRRIGHLKGLSGEGLDASNKLPLLFFIQNPAFPKSTLRPPQFVSVVKYAFLQMSFSRPPLNSFLQNTAQTHLCTQVCPLASTKSPHTHTSPPHTSHTGLLRVRAHYLTGIALRGKVDVCQCVCMNTHVDTRTHARTHPETADPG